SAGDLATRLTAIVPPAPGLFSTITGCFRRRCSCSASARASVSVPAPGAKPTTMVIGRSDPLDWADAGATSASAAQAAPIQRMGREAKMERKFIGCLLVDVVSVCVLPLNAPVQSPGEKEMAKRSRSAHRLRGEQ